MSRIQPQDPIDFCGLSIIGEAPGADEIKEGKPFVGKAGRFLNTILEEVGIERSRCHVTNVFLDRPEGNKIDKFFRTVQEGDGEYTNRYGLFRGNKVVRNANRYDLDRLEDELADHQPKLILLLGATALWRINRANGITGCRGDWTLTLLPRINHMVGIMPTWHPSAVMRGKLDDTNSKFKQFVADIRMVREVLEAI